MKNSKYLVLAFLLIFIKGISQSSGLYSEEDLLLEQLASEHQIIGVSAAYSIQGKVKWKNAVGYSHLKEKVPFTDTTLTRIASIAKPMTAIAVMQLVEKGLIDLEAPIQTYLPDFPKNKKGDITVKQLLSHTAGIPGYKNAKEAETKEEFSKLSQAVDVFKNRKLEFEPGSDFYYTTYGYVVLGLIIEKVSGLTFEAYMQKNIWEKAGMQNTGVEKFDISYENKSELYHFEKGKTSKGVKNNLSNRAPGGGFYSSLNDMIKFGNGVLDHLFIQESTFQEMIEIHSLQKEGNPYGYGWFLYGPKPNENVVIGHSGEQTGSAAQLMIIPKSKTVVVALSNTSGKWKEIIGCSAKLINLSEKQAKTTENR